MRKLLNFIISFICLLSLTAIPAWSAPNDLVIRLGEPKSPTNLNEFDISFVALDILGRDITVKCLKKSTIDADFSQFGGLITLTSGGNTDVCHISSSVFDHNDTYQLKVEASAGTDTAADQVEVQFGTDGPETPIDYNKEKPSSCQYKISFKTAADSGRTVKVELYRSQDTSFTADLGSRVDSISAGSDESHYFLNNISDCDQDYYYAIRAFDIYGNGSGIIGDSLITVTSAATTTTITTTTLASPVSAIPVAEPTGTVLAETAAQSEESELTSESSEPVTPSPEILGKRTNRLLLIGFLIAMGIATLIYVIVKTLKQKKQP